MDGRSSGTMRPHPQGDDGLTVNQLVISLAALLLLGGLWTVFSKKERSPQPQSSLIEQPSLNG